ncbi:MAG: TolB family protein [Phycisphaerae bacterium]
MPEPIPCLESIPIGPAGADTSLSYYNTTPESPDGSAVVYARFDCLPELPRQPVSGSLWVCRPDGGDHQRIATLHALTIHNSACQQWIDNRTLAYHDGDAVHVVDLDGRALIEPMPGLLEHQPHGRRVLVSRRCGSDAGAYELDVDTGQARLICRPADFARFADRFPPHHEPDPAQWSVLHLQYNPGGRRIAMRFDMGKGEPFRYVMTCNLDGSQPVCFGPKPMHFVWFDDETLMGHDHQVADGLPDDRHLRRYTQEGSAVETLAGPGNHTAAAPGRERFASETWYHEPVIRLQLYRRGETTPAAVIDEHQRADIVWGRTFHANPSFSRDGRRVYFNHVDRQGNARVMAAEVGDVT